MIEPAWFVTQAAPFVCGETGSVRDLDFVTWEMRLSVVLALVHWKLRAAGVWTVEMAEEAGATADRMLTHVTYGQERIQT